MDIEKLKELVVVEAINLKKHATTEELNKLDFDRFNPRSIYRCIYGQMTGSCYSERAGGLLRMCTSVYYDNMSGEVAGDIRTAGKSLSPIEMYVPQIDSKNKTLIGFLKGDRDSLTIKDL